MCLNINIFHHADSENTAQINTVSKQCLTLVATSEHRHECVQATPVK